MRAMHTFVAITALVGVVALSGCGSSSKTPAATSESASPTGSSRTSSQPPSPSASPTALPTALDASAFCKGVDESAITKLIGPIVKRFSTKPGDKITNLDQSSGKATYYACNYLAGAADYKAPGIGVGYVPRPTTTLAEERRNAVKISRTYKSCAVKDSAQFPADTAFVEQCKSVHTTSDSKAFLAFHVTVGHSLLQCTVQKWKDPLPTDEAGLTDFCVAFARSATGS